MIVEYIVFATDTGEVIKSGQAPADMVAIQAGPGQRAIVIPAGVIGWNGVDLEPLRAKLVADVDTEAGAARARFITVIPGQDSTYIYKAREAAAWTSGADPATAPFLAAEAGATGAAIDDLAVSVLAMEAQWIAIGSAIEGARMGAKSALAAATDLPGMVAAITVDWDAVIAAAV
ncbi:MAG: hypothetical protein DI547_05010 [Sphingobium sp.]|nr:MAG: hypothetical protein DI547_05010 [Sphingobium sp.]